MNATNPASVPSITAGSPQLYRASAPASHMMALSILIISLISLGQAQPQPTTPLTPPINEIDTYRSLRSPDTLRVRLAGWPTTFHPYKDLTSASELINTLIHSSLLYYDQLTGKYGPYLAKSYHYSANFKTLTFKLQTTVLTAAGKPLTADDVAFSLHTLITQPCSDCERMAAALHQIKKFKVIDSHTIQINFHRGSRYHHRALALIPIITRDQDPAAAITTGMGAYALQLSGDVRVEYGKSIIFKRKSQPWQSGLDSFKDLFHFPTIEAVYLPDDRLALAAFNQGQLATFAFPTHLLTQWHQLQKQAATAKDIAWISYPRRHQVDYQFLAWNPLASETQDPLLREALYHLFPETTFLQAIAPHNNHTLASQPFVSAFPMSRPKRSMARATKLMRKLLKLKPTEPIPAGSIEVSLQYSDLAGSVWLSQYKDRAAQVGIKLNLVYRSLHKLLTATAAQKYDGVLLSHTLKHPEDIYELLHSEGSHNYWGLASPKLDDYLDELMVTATTGDRTKLEEKIAHTLLQSYTFMYLSKTKNHHMAYHTTQVSPLATPAHPYSSSIDPALYYLHWQPTSTHDKTTPDS